MTMEQLPAHNRPDSFLPWVPLIVAALCSYGPVAYNYGFALYFLDYRHGFVKRGLVGELFSGFAYLSGTQLLAIEYVFLAAAFALTYVVFRRMIFGTNEERRLAAVLLCAPAVLPHIGYLFAQPDVTLYLLVLACLWLLLRCSPQIAARATLPICCIGLLGHEAFSLMFYPLVVAVLLHLCAHKRLSWTVGVLHVLVAFAALVCIVHFGALKVAPAQVLAEAQARTNVGIQRQVYDVMASNLTEQRALVHRMYSPAVLHTLYVTIALSIPYFGLLGWMLRRAMRAARCTALQQAVTLLIFISPLALCALGHDTTRWIGAMGIDATFFLLFLLLSKEDREPVRETLKSWACSSQPLAWMAYLIAIGPYGATGIRSAEQIVNAWGLH